MRLLLLTTIQNLTKDKRLGFIRRQPVEELEAIKEELDMGFDYLDHPLAFNHVKVQVKTMLKGR
jgi:hypothetical protein